MPNGENKTSQKQIGYVKKYQGKRDAIMLRPSKEDGLKLRTAAANIGKSVQAFVMETMLEKIEKENLLNKNDVD